VAVAARSKSRPSEEKRDEFNATVRREGAKIIFDSLGQNWREYIAVIASEKGTFRALQAT
jgi:hypothetical protein